MVRNSITLFLLFSISILNAQKPIFQGTVLQNGFENNPALLYQFQDFDVVQIDVQAFDGYIKNAGTSVDFELRIGNKYHWDMSLEPKDIRSPNIIRRAVTDEGIQTLPKTENLTFGGRLNGPGGGPVALTVDHNFIFGYIEKDGEHYFIEPLRYYVPGQPVDRFVVYASSDVNERDDVKCGFTEINQQKEKYDHKVKDQVANGEKMMGCVELDLAIAADFSMFQKYGSETLVEAHITGVMFSVQTNYDDEFNDEIRFNLIEFFIVSTAGGDPWTSSTSPSALLNSFMTWAGGGFASDHDLGGIWTDRNFNGSVIGIAFLSSVCAGNKYHAIQDFSTNACLMRVLVAHEIGHNFSATHNSGIMAPSVNCTNFWTATSLNEINSFYPTRGCLSNCSAILPPIADFSADPTEGCAPLQVQFTDLSTNSPTTWNWTFTGGTPSSSTDQNPVIVYNTAGVFDVMLTAGNSVGATTITKSSLILVEELAVPNFTFVQTGLNVDFVNLSTNASSYEWDFGDGNTSSLVQPSHTYATDGFYLVTLTAFNACGGNEFSFNIPVFTLPAADFIADPTTGCASFDVTYTDNSTPNVLVWAWEFEGGSPATSTQSDPTVTYSVPGVYSTTLTVSNPAGENTFTQTMFITVGTSPVAEFSSVTTGSSVSFVNETTNTNGLGALTYLWDFGDGNTSTETNPEHTYTTSATFDVSLIATNDCGADTISHSITIEQPPSASFSALPTEVCEGEDVVFSNTSTGGSTSFAWAFPGGTPSSSTLENPVVTYSSPGSYDVTLEVTNNIGSDTITLQNFITVAPLPSAGFSAGTNGLEATFTNLSTNATSYFWDFGDNSNSTEANPAHTYPADGSYEVELTAINDCDSVSSTSTIIIVTAPSANFSAGATTGCAPFTVQFNNQSSANAVDFEWTFEGGDPATSTDENPMVTFASAGTFDVTLTVTNAAGSSTVSESDYIAVNNGPQAGFTANMNGNMATFTNTSANAMAFIWNFGDGSGSTETNPEHEYMADGNYTVELTAANECDTVSMTSTITIVTAPSANFSAGATTGCAPLAVQFNNQSSANAVDFEWTFEGGDPATSTDENPMVTFASAGTFDVTLTVTNSAGSSTSTETDYVVVSTVPSTSFTASTNVFIANFNNTTSGATSYQWDFGDGEISTETNPEHEYAGDGTYTVTLTATNDCGTGSATQQVTISSLPQAGFSASQTMGCEPLEVEFSNQSSSNATSWMWEFPGGSPATSTDENPTVTYGSSGTYSVTLTATNSLGESTVSETAYITVIGVPTPGFTTSTDMLTATFSNTSSEATSYSWDFGDGHVSTDESPAHTYEEDGIYEVSLSATNSCGTVVSTETITIVSAPSAAFSASTATGCSPFEVTFTNQSSANATSFEWQFEGGSPATSTDENPTVTYMSPGVFNVTLTASNAAGEDQAIQMGYIAVGTAPGASFATSIDGLTATFDNSSANPANSGNASYEWDFGDGQSSTEESPSHSYTEDGVYTVTLTVTNDCGSATTTSTVVIATQGPVAAFSVENQTGCLPYEVTFDNLSSENATSFQWFFEGGEPSTSDEETPTVVYNSLGEFEVTLVATNSLGSDTFSVSPFITVVTAPMPDFDTEDEMGTVTFTNNSINADSYEWDFGDGETSTEENPVHVYSTSGEYTVTLTATNGCGPSAITQTIAVIITGVDEIPGIADFNIFPNPNSGRFTLMLSGEAVDELKASFTNLLGQVILQDELDFRTGQLTKEFVFDDLAAGIYIFQLKSGNGSLYKKIMVK